MADQEAFDSLILLALRVLRGKSFLVCVTSVITKKYNFVIFVVSVCFPVPMLQRSSLYTNIFKPVIPAWMPESSHRDVKVRRHPALRIDVRGSEGLPSMALDTGIHAGMTTLGQTCSFVWWAGFFAHRYILTVRLQ